MILAKDSVTLSPRCLSEDDVKQFYRLFDYLLAYANQKLQVREYVTGSDVRELPVEEIVRIRIELFTSTRVSEIISDYVATNPDQLTPEELEIIAAWVHFVYGKSMIICKAVKDSHYLLVTEPDEEEFTTTGKVYAIKGLVSDIDDVVQGELPVLVYNVILLPFKGVITYDGLFMQVGPRIYFGAGMRRSITRDYQEAKITHGIITKLPFVEDLVNQNETRLKVMMSSKANIDEYWTEIQSLRLSDSSLENSYQQYLCKAYAGRVKKSLKNMGINHCHIAMYDGYLVAADNDKKLLEANIARLLDETQCGRVFYAQLR